MQDEIQVIKAENEKKMIDAAYFLLSLLEINVKKTRLIKPGKDSLLVTFPYRNYRVKSFEVVSFHVRNSME
jgi:hypothetical protein